LVLLSNTWQPKTPKWPDCVNSCSLCCVFICFSCSSILV
jgi:hypothetical protein